MSIPERKREVTLVIDDSYSRGGYGLIPPQVVTISVDPTHQLSRIISDLQHVSKRIDPVRGQHASVATIAEAYESDAAQLPSPEQLQQIVFAYGEFGELRMLPLPFENPVDLSLDQIDRVVSEHYPAFDSSRLVVRYVGGFGAAGGTSLVAAIALWLAAEGASFIFQRAFQWLSEVIQVGSRKSGGLNADQRNAQVARDLISRRIQHLRDIRTWLDTKQVWTRSQVQQALVLSKRQTKRLLREAGYARVGMSGRWVRGEDQRSTERRALWMEREKQGFGWSPLDESP